MQRNSEGQIRLGLASGTIVELGDRRDLGDKLMAAAAVLSNTDANTVATLDVRSSHLPLVTLKVSGPSQAQSVGAVSAKPAPGTPTGRTATTTKPNTSTTSRKASTTTTTRRPAASTSPR